MVAIVDDETFNEIAQYLWCYDGAYAVRRKMFPDGKARKVYLHREIMGSPHGLEVDHRNRNKMDCRRENLRIGTGQQNHCNMPLQKSNKSGYRGVHFSKRNQNWVAQLSCKGKMITVGSFDSAEEAASAYNTAALEHHGEFAHLN